MNVDHSSISGLPMWVRTNGTSWTTSASGPDPAPEREHQEAAQQELRRDELDEVVEDERTDRAPGGSVVAAELVER